MLSEIIAGRRHPRIPSHLDPRPVSRVRGAIAASSRFLLVTVARGLTTRLEKMTSVLLSKYLKVTVSPRLQSMDRY